MSQPIKLAGFDAPKPRVIDATRATHMCLLVLENGNDEGKEAAREELLRYARELDRLAAQSGSAFDPSDTPVEGE